MFCTFSRLGPLLTLSPTHTRACPHRGLRAALAGRLTRSSQTGDALVHLSQRDRNNPFNASVTLRSQSQPKYPTFDPDFDPDFDHDFDHDFDRVHLYTIGVYYYLEHIWCNVDHRWCTDDNDPALIVTR